MSLTIVTRHPAPDSTVRVVNRGTEDAPRDRVRIETRGPCDLDAREARMLASRLIRWSATQSRTESAVSSSVAPAPSANMTMKTFKSTMFSSRDYETTNVVACRADKAPEKHWIECDESVLSGLDRLWTQGSVTYYGHL